ncbi:MAG: hypothetical protein HY674_14335 [Chloroflexi bacterium]|nr:hypothetical protein [Chloroflexota bacterium]
MKRIVAAMLLTAALLAPGASALAQDKDKPEVISLLFYADRCGSCKALEPTLDAMKKGFADKPLLFTRVDKTDDHTKSQSKLFAGALGVSEICNENAPKTSFMLLVHAQDKNVLGKLVKTQSADEIKTSISTALAPGAPASGSGAKPLPGSGTKRDPTSGKRTRDDADDTDKIQSMKSAKSAVKKQAGLISRPKINLKA